MKILFFFSFYYQIFTHSAFFYIPGILHKGCGENVFVCQQPPVITSIMGNGRRRSISCPSCNGLADGNKLLAPVALAAGIDGSLYVGDLNFVRRVYPSLNTTRVLELRYTKRISYFSCIYFLIFTVIVRVRIIFSYLPFFHPIEIRIFVTGEPWLFRQLK